MLNEKTINTSIVVAGTVYTITKYKDSHQGRLSELYTQKNYDTLYDSNKENINAYLSLYL